MRTQTSSFRLEHPDLGPVVVEIIERICRADSERRSSSGEDFVYYTMGFSAQQVEAERLTDFAATFPLPSQGAPLTRWLPRLKS